MTDLEKTKSWLDDIGMQYGEFGHETSKGYVTIVESLGESPFRAPDVRLEFDDSGKLARELIEIDES